MNLKKINNSNKKKDEIDNFLDEVVEGRLFAQTKTNPTACFFWLCNRKKDKWQNVNKVEHSGHNGDPVKFVIEYAK